MKFIKPDVPYATANTLPSDFRQFLAYVWRKNPVLWFFFFLEDLIHFVRYPITFILLGMIIDTLQGSNPADGIPTRAILLLIGIVLTLGIGELMHIITAHTIIHWKPKLRTVIRSDFLTYTMGHSHSYFQDNFAGAIARKISEVAESALRLHDIIRFQIWYALIQITTSLTYMLYANVIYGLAFIAFIIAVTVPVVLRLPRIRQRSFRYSEQRALVTGIIVDMLSNIPAVKSFASLPHEVDVHGQIANEERTRASKVIRSMVQLEDMRRICLVILGGGMTTLACYGWSRGWITVGEASSISTLSLMLTGTVWMLGGAMVQLVDEAGYITDALRITTRPHAITDKPDAKKIEISKGLIEFRDVCFSFSGHPIFNPLNMSIQGGEKIAIVGPSGSGKSTFVSCLLRLYDLEDGAILIDGQSIADVTQDSLHDAIAVIPQDTSLFHRSLMENIRYGRRDATDEEVFEASKKAFAHDFITTLPDGYNTMVGERGIRLSGGQRQRIAIARAILKNAPILVLDEATSALDSESERLIQSALVELMRGKTVIAIAHRLSTIARMDRIFVFEPGRIAEQGSHAELLQRPGLYARLWSMQSGGFLQENALDDSGTLS